MGRTLTLWILLALLVVVTGCEEVDDALGTEREEAGAATSYRYTGYTPGGIAVIVGHLHLVEEDGHQVNGEWHLQAVGPQVALGPQVGKGNLVGGRQNGLVYLDLNPGFMDNNVTLMGRVEDKVIRGEWQWVGLTGVRSRGTFIARRP